MIYNCDICGRKDQGDPGHFSYGFIKGKPFVTKVCPECRSKISDKGIKALEEGYKPLGFAEELGILGQ